MDDALLSKETLLELRSEQFNVKRWVSRAMAEAKRNSNSTSPQPASSAGLSPHSPSSPTVPSVPPRSAATAPGQPLSDEAAAQQLATLLGVRKQSAAEGLEETISAALRNLPRATEDISRLVADSATLREKLKDVADSTAQVRDSASVSDKLRELHEVRSRLIKCRVVLNDAQLLASRAAAVEQAIASLHGGTLPNAIGSPQSAAAPGKPARILDMTESNRIADDIASMRAALRTLQEIDPTYGASLRSQVDRFEQLMLKGLESQCLEALRREDKTTAPALLAALKKIGREAGVVKHHTDALVTLRIDKFKADIAAHSGPSVGDKHLPSLRRCLHSLVKVLGKDRAFLDDVISTSNADGAADATAATASDTGYLTSVCERVATELTHVITHYTNEGLLQAAEVVQQELTTPLGSGALASGAAGQRCIAVLMVPFINAASKFGDAEAALVDSRVAAAKSPSDLQKIDEELKSSCRRVTSFINALSQFSENSPSTVAPQAKTLLTKSLAMWNNAGVKFAAAVAVGLPKAAVPAAAGSGATHSNASAARAALEASVAFYTQCGDLKNHVSRLRTELTELVHPAAARVDIPPSTVSNFFSTAATAIAELPNTCRNNVLAIVLEPVKSMLPTASSFAGSATLIAGSQSESVRTLGDWVMELPMTLENAGVTSDVQEWVAAAVVYLINLYGAAVQSIIAASASSSPAAAPAAGVAPPVAAGLGKTVSEQLLADVEYLETVVNAIDETPANTESFTELRRAIVAATH